jgi:hypothetical protein
LERKLKAKGLPVLEDTAEKAVEALFEWLDESAELSESSIDDLLSVLYPQIKSMIDKKVDKIDGVADQA